MIKTFTEWLKFLKPPTETELFIAELKRIRPCKGDCGTLINGFHCNGMCAPCFSKDLYKQYEPLIKYMP